MKKILISFMAAGIFSGCSPSYYESGIKKNFPESDYRTIYPGTYVVKDKDGRIWYVEVDGRRDLHKKILLFEIY